MKRAICSWSNRRFIKSITYPVFNRYAKYYGLDFIYDWPKIKKYGDQWLYWAYQKFGIYDILDNYDQVCWIDDDILITNNAKNIFDFISAETFGFVPHPSIDDSYMNLIKKIFNINNWWIKDILNINSDIEDLNSYPAYNTTINSGVMVVSQLHKDIFNYEFLDPPYAGYEDQSYINAYINNHRIPYKALGYEWNLSTGFFHAMEVRKKSYFLHVNGRGWDNVDKVIKKNKLPEPICHPIKLEENWIPGLTGKDDGPDLYRAKELLYFIKNGVEEFTKE